MQGSEKWKFVIGLEVCVLISSSGGVLAVNTMGLDYAFESWMRLRVMPLHFAIGPKG